MGTGCDTILAQMAAECLECSLDDIAVLRRGHGRFPLRLRLLRLQHHLCHREGGGKGLRGAEGACARWGRSCWTAPAEEVEYARKTVRRLDGSAEVSLADIATKSMCGNGTAVQATCSHTSPISPPPFMVGMAEVEVDRETGSVQVLDYAAVVDCGTPINPNLARVQTEGGMVQGIGMALFEDVTYTPERAACWRTP